MKYLVVFAVLAVAYALWRNQRSRPGAAQRPGLKAPQNMVACAYCGVHLPRSEAIAKGGDSFCCQEHRDLSS